MTEHDNLRDALQQMVDAFSPYGWGSIDSKRDALNAATAVLASPPVAVQEEGDATNAATWIGTALAELDAFDLPDDNNHLAAATSALRKALAAMKGDKP